MNKDITWHRATVTKQRREVKNQHKGALFWFTGLSGSGKSTLAHAVEEKLFLEGFNTIVLDGDNVRHGLCADLSFTDKDREENIRRIAHLSNLFVEAGIIVLTAFISPFKNDREKARSLLKDNYHEIYCDCDISVCEERDVKGLYQKARAGEISHFTGIDSPYEIPEKPELSIKTEQDLNKGIENVYCYIYEKVALKFN